MSKLEKTVSFNYKIIIPENQVGNFTAEASLKEFERLYNKICGRLIGSTKKELLDLVDKTRKQIVKTYTALDGIDWKKLHKHQVMMMCLADFFDTTGQDVKCELLPKWKDEWFDIDLRTSQNRH